MGVSPLPFPFEQGAEIEKPLGMERPEEEEQSPQEEVKGPLQVEIA